MIPYGNGDDYSMADSRFDCVTIDVLQFRRWSEWQDVVRVARLGGVFSLVPGGNLGKLVLLKR